MAKQLKIAPCTLAFANKYVVENHRHHTNCTGCKFAIKLLNSNEQVCGVAICGRPVSRYLDDGYTLEVNRLCTDGTKNACSCLYSACARIAKEMGYTKIITYILQSETGVSLKASGWFCDDCNCGGLKWNGRSEPKTQKYPAEKKQRFIKNLL